MPPPRKPAAKPATSTAKAAGKSAKGKGLPFGDDAPADRAAPPAEPRITSLDDVLGHEGPKRTLRAAAAGGRVHHAWVFAGEAGLGKFTSALAFAAELLLPPSKHADHERLRALLRAGNHPDLHVVTKELAAISRDAQIRKQKQTTIAKAVLDEFLLEPASRTRVHTSPSAVAKVFVVDEAELIDATGQNTLLKTLEEPPAGTVIILVTAVESRLLPTVRSRCQRIAFGPVPDADVARALAARRPDVPPAQRQWAVTFARGSLGAALFAVDQGLYAWQTEIAPMLDAAVKAGAAGGGGRGPGALGAAMTKAVDARTAAAVEKRPEASKEAANRLWSKRMLGFVAERVRTVLTAGGADPESLLRAIDLCREAERQIDANVQYGTVFDNLAAQMMTPGEAALADV